MVAAVKGILSPLWVSGSVLTVRGQQLRHVEAGRQSSLDNCQGPTAPSCGGRQAEQPGQLSGANSSVMWRQAEQPGQLSGANSSVMWRQAGRAAWTTARGQQLRHVEAGRATWTTARGFQSLTLFLINLAGLATLRLTEPSP